MLRGIARKYLQRNRKKIMSFARGVAQISYTFCLWHYENVLTSIRGRPSHSVLIAHLIFEHSIT